MHGLPCPRRAPEVTLPPACPKTTGDQEPTINPGETCTGSLEAKASF